MKRVSMPAIVILSATLAACGSTDFEWFPKVDDATAPTVIATIGGNALFNNASTHVTLPAAVVFSATEPAIIYYTTNGSDPTTASPSVDFVTSPVAGPSISITNTILKFFGIDKSPKLNKSEIQKATIFSP